MSARKGAVTLVCDGCGREVTFGFTTVKSTRDKAHRFMWRVAWLADYRAGVSSDPRKHDLCPTCARADQ